MKRPFFRFCLVSLLLLPAPAQPWFPRLEANSAFPAGSAPPVVGENRSYILGTGETLIELAWRAGVGYGALLQANPGIDPWLPPAGGEILLPTSAILPPEAEPGITINLAELRLYHVWEEGEGLRVRIYPIGIGREGWETPLGTFEVMVKVQNPSWRVPAAIRAEKPDSPALLPPGPDNPLGDYWLGLSAEGVGIHGTNQPFGVGRRVSHGCIRLYPRDIADLASRVAVGTPVRIIYRPLKFGLRDGILLAEVHPDYLGGEKEGGGNMVEPGNIPGFKGRVDQEALRAALAEARGIPVPISDGR